MTTWKNLLSSLLASAERVDKLWDYLMQVADKSISGDLKNWRVWVFVDRDDDSRIFDTGQMLDRAGNANANIKLRPNALASLSYLKIVGPLPASTAARVAPTAPPNASANPP